jgi:hypothetical protein
VDLGAGIAQFLSLEAGIERWAEPINRAVPVADDERRSILDRVRNGTFSLSKNVGTIKALYTRPAGAEESFGW